MRSPARGALPIAVVAAAALAGVASARSDSCSDRAYARVHDATGPERPDALEVYVADWVRGYVEVCEDAAAPAFDQRMRCLDEALAQAAALHELTTDYRFDDETTADAAAKLPRVSECAAIASTMSLPQMEDPEAIARVHEIHALALLLELDHAEAAIATALPRVRQIGDQVAIGKLEWMAGILRLEAQDAQGAIDRLLAALAVAEACGDERTAALAAASLMRAHAVLRDFEASDRYSRRVDVIMQRFDAEPGVRFHVANELAVVAEHR